ncbi:MAG TPA: riboflavin biosynthesis protein RibF [Acidobacteriaceae bacterium]|nr:riboflavin biosynthesis protein RibF [Acidobacteriaceae bacterium]
MQIFRSLTELPAATPSVVTIGNFDGVHRGHRMVIDAVIARARELNARSIAVTFDPHPARVLKPEADIRLITPLPQKLELLAATGLDATLVLPFTPAFASLSAREFATTLLRDGLHAVEVHEGESFRFGHDAAEDVTGLTQLGRELGFAVRAYRPYMLRGAAVSSSRIRSLIAAGDMHHVRSLLGRSFAIRSTSASGRGYGTLYTVPTINLAPYTDLLPANGVYVSTLRVGSRIFRAVTNAGNRPTFGADSFAIESHLFDFEPLTLTEDTPLELTFLHRLRGEIRFPSPEALRAQIGIDIQQANRYFALCSKLVAGNS